MELKVPERDKDLDVLLNNARNKYITSNKVDKNLFDIFLLECDIWYDRPVNNMKDLKTKNTATKGGIFEVFCLRYLQHIYYTKYKEKPLLYLTKDIPEKLREKLHLPSRDMGIDIIVDFGNYYHAIQCKYRSLKSKSKALGWSKLSTFHNLCANTGPWQKKIVCTTYSYIRNMGKKDEASKHICLKRLRSLTLTDWSLLLRESGNLAKEGDNTNIDIAKQLVEKKVDDVNIESIYGKSFKVSDEVVVLKKENGRLRIANKVEEIPEKKQIKNRTKTQKKPSLEELRKLRCNYFEKQQND